MYVIKSMIYLISIKGCLILHLWTQWNICIGIHQFKRNRRKHNGFFSLAENGWFHPTLTQQEYYVDDKIQGIDEHYVLSKKGSASWQHLNTLYKENLKLFQEILLEKCKESYQIYKEQYIFFRELNEHISCKENETFMWVCLTMMQKISDIQVKVKELL